MFLAWCFTERSEINDILRSAGVYSALKLSENRSSLTGRYFVLDDAQKELIELIAKDHEQAQSPGDLDYKNVFLWGNSGTGKTVMLAELISMRISYYKRCMKVDKDFKLNVIVTAESAGSQLLEDLKTRYLSHLKKEANINVSFFQWQTLMRLQWKGKWIELYNSFQSPNVFFFSFHRVGRW